MIFAKTYDTIERLCSNTTFLATVAVLILGLFITSSYLAYQNSSSEAIQSLKANMANQTKAIARSIEEYFRGKEDAVQLMANFLLVQEYLDRVLQDTIESDPHFVNLCSLLKTVSGPDKDIAIAWLASLRDEYSLSYDDISYEKDGWSTRTRDWFPGTMAAENIYFSDPYMDFETGEVCVSLIKKVYAPTSDDQEGTQNSGEVVGVAGLDLFFPPIRKAMGAFVNSDLHHPILISNDGSILYHPQADLVFKSKLGDIDPMLEQFTESMTRAETAIHLVALNQGANPVYFGYMPVSGTNWSIGIIWDKSDAEKALVIFERTLVRSLLLNLVLFVIPIGFFSFVLINRRRRFMKMKRLYDTIMEQITTGIAVINPKTDTFVLTNPAYRYYLNIPPGENIAFSTYGVALGVFDSGEMLQEATTLMLSINKSETSGILLRMNDTERHFSHFFAEFYDYAGHRLILSVLSDVTDLKKMQETLQIARDAAESANRAKSSFLANMSHEIRTPMNGIIGLADLLGTSSLELKQQQYVDLIRSSAGALLTIINDILDHSKIEAGKLLIESYSFDLQWLIRELAFSFSHAAQQKSVELRTTVAPDVPQFVKGDATRLRQVLSNFLGNAIKFTPSEGTVKLKVYVLDDPRKPDWVCCEVSDNGIGITEEQQARLFTPFEQADNSTSRKFGGTGLGLAISKKLITMMGGNIGCHSKHHTGSVFWCELPLPASTEAQTSGAQTSADLISQPLHILLVDDVKVNLIVLSSMLQQWGHFIDTAENGMQAIERMKTCRYDLVFMDCQMPEMDGYECTRRVRLPETGTLYPSVPIIAVTAHAMTGDKEQCLASGMDDYISKPIDHGELQSKLFKWITKIGCKIT